MRMFVLVHAQVCMFAYAVDGLKTIFSREFGKGENKRKCIVHIKMNDKSIKETNNNINKQSK